MPRSATSGLLRGTSDCRPPRPTIVASTGSMAKKAMVKAIWKTEKAPEDDLSRASAVENEA